MKRVIDLIFATILCIILIMPMIIIAILIRLTSKGEAIYWSKRVGLNNNIFNMPKFRTMRINTPVIATHLLSNEDINYSPFGYFLRRTSLDELPQIFSILRGDMSFVGPRPALFNQDDLIQLRTKHNINKLMPGITGWAQVNGRDELSIADKVDFDLEYMKNKSFLFDLKILQMTLFKVVRNDGVKH
jgi:O-antigen biosynthesis protein WbqP